MPAVTEASQRTQFDTKTFLSTANGGKEILAFAKKQTIFAQDAPSEAVFYIHRGKVRLNVASKAGKDATIAILNEGDFFGEGCLIGQPLRLCSAIAMTDCSVMRIDNKLMAEVLHRELDFAVMFLTYVLTRNQRYESDLVDRFFSSSEKRLARILLLLAHFGEGGKLEAVIPRISQEALAEMVGTTRSRVGFFINKFRAQGFVGYDNRNQLQVHSSLRNVLRDTPGTISALVQP
jgi:CRP-like cAMP-binding protein